MGIVVEYRGRLEDLSRLDAALDTVRHFCREVGWECSDSAEQVAGVMINPEERDLDVEAEAYDEDSLTRVTVYRGDVTISWDEKSVKPVTGLVRGVWAQAPGGGRFPLMFDSEGWLGHYIEMAPEWLAATPYARVRHYQWSPMATKTSLGGLEFHLGVCAILKRLERDFLPKLEVFDDTDYFETGDVEALRGEHRMMASFLGAAQAPGLLRMLLRAAGLPGEAVSKAEPALKAKAKTTVH